MLFSFPLGTKMFQFPRFPPRRACAVGAPRECGADCSIRKSSDQRMFGSSPRLIAAYYVLLRLTLPRHPPYALTITCAYPGKIRDRLRTVNRCSINCQWSGHKSRIHNRRLWPLAWDNILHYLMYPPFTLLRSYPDFTSWVRTTQGFFSICRLSKNKKPLSAACQHKKKQLSRYVPSPDWFLCNILHLY